MQNLPEDFYSKEALAKLVAEQEEQYRANKPLAEAMIDLMRKRRAEEKRKLAMQAMEYLTEIFRTYPSNEPCTVENLESHIKAHVPAFFEWLDKH